VPVLAQKLAERADNEELEQLMDEL
jgi:hypothetical protein